MPILAHAGQPVTPHDVWGAWTLDWSLLALLGAAVLVYGHTVRARWRSGGRGAGLSRRQVAWFGLGIGTLVVALVSPLDAVSESLFAAHMVQHLLLTLVAAPLLLLGRVHLGLLPVLPVGWRRRGARWLARRVRRSPAGLVVGAVGLHIAALLVWHVPAAYDAAVRHAGLHVTEHTTLVVSALGFWAVMGAARPRPVAVAGLAAFVASLVSVLLAATMTAATHPWYTSHRATAGAWGLDPLRDQQMAAAIMWVPGGIVYLSAAAAAVYRWIRADERRLALQRHAAPPP